jgi:GH25 family lysozyme M1 (1,4-beta-N-acetylmuramidase)
VIDSPRRGLAASAVRKAPLLLALALAAAPLISPAAASVLGPDRSGRGGASHAVEHPGEDWLGSQIRKHEGAIQLSNGLRVPHVYGMDVSGHQANVDWSRAYAKGARFAYVKATEGTSYWNPYFNQQYSGAYQAGLIHGAYHFALPNDSSGATQARYFVRHGGGWSPDGRTLPPVLDIEYNPYSRAGCYGLSPREMVAWIRSFSTAMHAETGRYPVIYTSTNWWKQCTGDSRAFADTNPLWIGGPLRAPAGWKQYTFWQYAPESQIPSDIFNGRYRRLMALTSDRP